MYYRLRYNFSTRVVEESDEIEIPDWFKDGTEEEKYLWMYYHHQNLQQLVDKFDLSLSV